MKIIGKLVTFTMLLALVSCLKTGEDPEINIKNAGPSYYGYINSIEAAHINATNYLSSYYIEGWCSNEAEGSDVSVSYSDGTNPQIISYGNCSANYWYIYIGNMSSLDDGDISLELQIYDNVENYYYTNYTIKKDIVPPTGVATAPVNISMSNENSYELSGTCNDSTAHLEIIIEGNLYYTNCDGVEWTLTTSVSSLNDGAVNIAVKLHDPVMNEAVLFDGSVTKDSTPPTINTSNFSVAANNTKTNKSFAGLCSEDGRSITITYRKVSDNSFVSSNSSVCGTPTSGEFNFGHNFTTSIIGQEYYFELYLDDAAGNSVTVNSDKILIDNTPPNPATITIPDAYVNAGNGKSYINSNNKDAFTVSGTCEVPGGNVWIALGPGSYPGAAVYSGFVGVSCSASNDYSVTFDFDKTTTPYHIINSSGVELANVAFDPIPAGDYSIKVSHQDLAGNLVDTYTPISFDVNAPLSPTGLMWEQSSTSPYLTNHPTWTPSVSADLAKQKLQVHKGTSCGSLTKEVPNLPENKVEYYFRGEDGNSYSYQIVSYDDAGNSGMSACSSSIAIALPSITTGTPDNSWGPNYDGKYIYDEPNDKQYVTMLLDDSERILLGGFHSGGTSTTIRVDATGNLDSSNFATGGVAGQHVVTWSGTTIWDMAFAGSSIFIAGYQSYYARRLILTSTGATQTSLAAYGLPSASPNFMRIYSVVEDPNTTDMYSVGTMYTSLGDYHLLIAKTTSTGVVDTGFGNLGETTFQINSENTQAKHVELVDQGTKLLICGVQGNGAFVIKTDLSGNLDTTFSGDGMYSYDYIGGVDVAYRCLQGRDGKYYVAGNFGMIRLNHNGTLDNSYGSSGYITNGIGYKDIVLQNDDMVVGVNASSGDFVLYRYNYDGTLDTTFDSDGILTVDMYGGDDIGLKLFKADGKLYVGGRCKGVTYSTVYSYCALKLN